MPIYLFQHPQTNEVIEIIQPMAQVHEYIDKHGVQWQRVFTKPTASIKDKKIDLRSKKDRDLYASVYKKRYEYNKKKGKIDNNGEIK